MLDDATAALLLQEQPPAETVAELHAGPKPLDSDLGAQLEAHYAEVFSVSAGADQALPDMITRGTQVLRAAIRQALDPTGNADGSGAIVPVSAYPPRSESSVTAGALDPAAQCERLAALLLELRRRTRALETVHGREARRAMSKAEEHRVRVKQVRG